MGIGLLLLAAALFLTVYNFWSDAMASVSSNTALEYLKPNNKEHTGVSLPVLPSGETLEEAYLPDYVLNPEMDMPEKEVDGQRYIGVLRIPALSLELPVISEWSYSGLKESPCRYIGSAYLNNMVIVAHNYFSHFGHLKDLSQGDEITFTDVDGNMFRYEVIELETLSPFAIAEMTGGNWDLTLFTCTVGGQYRVTVRCVLANGGAELLQELLSDAGVSDGRIQGFFRRVDRFNDSVKQEWLTDGFEEAELLYTKYDPYTMQDEWTAKNGTFPGYNCRITAMSLFGDFLSVSADSQINAGEDVLFVDEETLKTDPNALGGSSLADFRALYSSVKVEDTTEIKRHVQAVQEEWASRGVAFRENERIRLITVFFHDKPTEEESMLFVGHVGVLLTEEDGTLYFVEKVAFQEPYRMLRFADRTALSDYLMGKYDTSWGQDTASPFIMENDKLMDGWRPNPDRGSSAID